MDNVRAFLCAESTVPGVVYQDTLKEFLVLNFDPRAMSFHQDGTHFTFQF